MSNTQKSISEKVLDGAKQWFLDALKVKCEKEKIILELIDKNDEKFKATDRMISFGCGDPKSQKATEEQFQESINNINKQKEMQMLFQHLSHSVITTFKQESPKKNLLKFQMKSVKFVIRKDNKTKKDVLTMQFDMKY